MVISTRTAFRTLAPAGLALLATALPAHAQQEALPEGAASPPPVTIAPPPAVLPQLSPAQASELVGLLREDALAQGLRRDRPVPSASMGNDALVRAALDHARAVHSTRLDPSDFQEDWGMRPDRYDPAPAFAEAVRTNRLASWVRSLAPPYAGYDNLRKGLANYRAIEAAGGWPALAAGPDLTLNATGPRVLALRRRLAVEDKGVATAGETFDMALLEAVRRAQRRYGLPPSGIVSSLTLAALNVPVADRIGAIMANMERWRWLPANLAEKRVQVNIAAAVLTVFDGDTPVTSMKAVTGRPGDETPMLKSQIHSVVLNPPWNVPMGIAERELWPKERANPGYLRRNGFRIIPLEGGGRRLQQASEQSALGRYKFDFDNPFAVYLHDTPAQAGFARYDRLASHGCVRLEKPGELAELLLRDAPDWNAGQIDATVAGGKTTRARLAQPVAVYLFYWTAFGSTNGQMNFRADPYGWDKKLAAKIEARGQAAALAAR